MVYKRLSDGRGDSPGDGRGVRSCCGRFKHGERYFCCFDAKAGVFRDGCERDRIRPNDDLLAFYSRGLTR